LDYLLNKEKKIESEKKEENRGRKKRGANIERGHGVMYSVTMYHSRPCNRENEGTTVTIVSNRRGTVSHDWREWATAWSMRKCPGWQKMAGDGGRPRAWNCRQTPLNVMKDRRQ